MIYLREKIISGKIRFILPIALFLLVIWPLSAQTAQRIEAMLDEPALNWGEAAIFALEASGNAAFSDLQEAFDYAKDLKWLPKKAQKGEPAKLSGVALLFMRAFELKGGIFYSLFKNPRFAYRELVYQEVIQGRADPDMQVSGADFLFMIGRVLSIVGDAELSPAAPAVENKTVEEKVERRTALKELAVEINTQLSELGDTTAELTAEGITIRLSNIQFNANSADIPESEKQKLREIAGILKAIPGKNILITGHTAMAGTREDRQRTSSERAQAAASYLIALGARRINEITVHGYGADRPIADNRTPQGMALNRRVEITILDN